ncbi:glutathione S-transferase family protein [Sandaracinobacteroides saxicola]|uniref:glutathione transferase n=1 Tax=Sandaracinobacteroides saxicola TaxID=2759707 RepID=A0A7G5IFA4_9SPHN|nr:glutathione S-transferase family protein [Sandaracinobacteroides saxicola]QMW22046.1 glutathione S-transferase family protein [Sandaracinobacteroides saxicola]
MSQVQVIGLPQSNFVWAVRIALAEKGIAHELVVAPPHSAEVNAIHPFGKLPVFRHGNVTLCESRTIIDYIDETFEGPPLVPTTREAALNDAQWTSIIATTIEPLLIRQYLFAYMFPQGAGGAPDRTAIDILLPKVEAALDILDDSFAAGKLGGEAFTRSDTYLFPILFYARTLPEGGAMISARRRLSSYVDRGLARSSILATMPPPPGQ